MIAGGGTLISIAVLRLMYGRLSSQQSQREEFVTYLGLLFFVVAFSLTVIRSPEGIARYQRDIEYRLSYVDKHNVVTPESVIKQLSLQRSKKLHTEADCATCHSAKRETLVDLAAKITADSDNLNKTFEKSLTPLQNTASSHARTIALLPKERNNNGFWKRLTGWLTSEGRETRALERQATLLISQKQGLDEKLSTIRSYYKVADLRQQIGLYLNGHTNAMQRHDTAGAAYNLLQAAAENDKFQKALVKGNDERNKAVWSLRIINWGCLLFVVAVLGGRILLRRLYSDAAWYIYPGTIFFWGISLVLMTDLGLNYVHKLRFLGYYTWSRLLICFSILLIMAVFCRFPLMHNLLSNLLERARCVSTKNTWLIIGFFLVAGLVGYLLPAQRVNDSELIKGIALVFFALYAVVRGDYISRRAQLKESMPQGWPWKHLVGIIPQGWVWHHLTDLLVASVAILFAFAFIHDFGPLLTVILLFSCYVWLLMGSRILFCLVVGWSTALALVWALRGVLSKNSYVAHIYRRIYEMIDPFNDGSTELAKLVWFRNGAGAFGYGKIPYFGHYVKEGAEKIVTPLQIQSDYTVSHLIGGYGYLGGLLLLGIYLAWLLKMMMDASVFAGDCTKRAAGRFVGWFLSIGILLMIIQVFLTFLGNFNLAPLTGITLPYISFGGTSLLFATMISAISYSKEKLQ